MDYLINFSIEQRIGQYKIKATIVDAKDSTIVETSIIKGKQNDLINLRDDLVSTVVATVSDQITDEEVRKCSSVVSKQPDAYSCLLQGLSIYKLGDVNLEDSRRALKYFEQTIELDPACARAYAWRACCGSDLVPDATDPDYLQSTAREIDNALSLDILDHEVHRMAGSLHIIIGNHDVGEYHLAKAAELNPNDTRVLLRGGFYRSFVREQTNDLVYINRAFDLNPKHPAYYYFNRAVVLFNQQRYADALTDFKISADEYFASAIYQAACHQALGQTSIAKESVRHIQNTYSAEMDRSLIRQYPFVCYGENEKSSRLFGFLDDAGLPIG